MTLWIRNRQEQLRQKALTDPHTLHQLLNNYVSFYHCPSRLEEALRDGIRHEDSLLHDLFYCAIAWQAQQDYQLVRETGLRTIIDLIEHPPGETDQPL